MKRLGELLATLLGDHEPVVLVEHLLAQPLDLLLDGAPGLSLGFELLVEHVEAPLVFVVNRAHALALLPLALDGFRPCRLLFGQLGLEVVILLLGLLELLVAGL